MLDEDKIYSLYEPKSERDNKLAGFLFLVAFIGGAIGLVRLVVYFIAESNPPA
ncbi:MAG: hypothetical protein R8G66_07310 [Cytophagales bacterium]|nr:hypothetical protein [Cytophagales bacterium]